MRVLETIIGNTLHQYFSIEWMRYNMFFSENIYKNIPMLVFRFNSDVSEETISKLIYYVDCFEGNEKWRLFKDPLSNRNNYILSIAVVEKIRKKSNLDGEEYNEIKYLGNDMYKKCCEQAIQDIPLLALYIQNNFSNKY